MVTTERDTLCEPRVLHLISSSGFLGAENVVLELARESRELGVISAIGLIENSRNPHRELADAAADIGIATSVFTCRGRLDFGALSQIHSFVDEFRPNVLHSHNYKSNFFGLAAIRHRIPWVVTNHLWKNTTPALRCYAWLDSLLIRRADAIVAVSDEIAQHMKKKGIAADKIRTIDNGVNLGRFSGGESKEAYKKALGFSAGTTLIGTVASLTVEKGHRILIAAFRHVLKNYANLRLILVGDGNERTNIEILVRDLGLTGKVVFAGVRRDIPQVLRALDIFVLPSFKEGLPMALLEAMAARLPVVATHVGAIPTVIRHRQNGLLVEPGDEGALAAALGEYLADCGVAANIAETGFQTIVHSYSSGIMTGRYVDCYRRVLSARKLE